MHLQNVVWEGFAVASLSSNDDGPYAQCFQPYTTLRDSWRSTGTGGGSHGDCSSGTGVGGGRWYRFAGAGGDALPLTHPGHGHCGTTHAGWLSGWATPRAAATRLQATAGRGGTRRRRRAWSRAPCASTAAATHAATTCRLGWCGAAASCCGGCRTRRAAPLATARLRAGCRGVQYVSTMVLHWFTSVTRAASPRQVASASAAAL